MKPIFLTIKGINSFEDEQRIDFKNLMEYGVFGIVGETGSGKTTIIDSIFLALYGRVPRYDKSNYNSFINKAAGGKANLKYEFEINYSNIKKIYLVEKSFNLKKDDKIETKIARLYEIVNGERNLLNDKITDVTKKIEDIIGLSYEDFAQTVILPQGKFSKFLNLKNSERKNMLERIFKLESYGSKLDAKVKESKNSLDVEKQIINSNISLLNNFTKDDISQVEANLISKKNKSQEINCKINELEINREKLKADIKKIYIYTETKNKFTAINNRTVEIKTLKSRTDLGRKCNEIYPSIKRKGELKKTIVELEIKLENLKNKKLNIESCEKDLAVIQSKLEDFRKNEYDNLTINIKKVEENLHLEEEITKLDKIVKSIISEIKNLENKKETINKSLNELKALYIKEEKSLKEINQYISENVITLEEKNEIAEANVKEKELIALEKDKKDKESSIEKINVEIEDSRNKLKLLKNNLEKLQEVGEFNSQNDDDSEYLKSVFYLKNSINIGESCPVCGEKIKNEIDKISYEEYLANKENKKKSELMEKDVYKIEETNKLQMERINLLHKDLENLTNLEKDTINIINPIKEKYKSDSVKKIYVDLNNKEKKLKTKEEEKRKIEHIIEEINSKINLSQLEENKIKEDIIVKVIDEKHNNEKLKELNLSLSSIFKEQKPSSLYKELTKKREEFLLKEEENKKIAIELSEKTVELEKSITEKYSLINELVINIKDFLEDDSMPREDEIEGNLLDISVIESNNKIIDEFKNEYLIIKDQLNTQENLVKNMDIEKVKKDNSNNDIELTQLKKDYSEIREDIAVTDNKIKKMNEDLIKLTSFKEELNKIDGKIINHEKLISVLKKHSFVEYVAEHQLKYIVQDASNRLKKMTNNKFSLELDDTDFTICDNFNGGIRRNTKSLSGGESFMVSLSLALALANKIQLKNKGSLDIFFLDEGFGALDKYSLELVLNNLFELSSHNVNFGLITHVDEVKDRVPKKLVVKKVYGKGSLVKVE
ncbi:MAG: SbcC/MukB-like Walker B domain-containing protein [Lachnospirales bacterium]